jgi:hypothetical protein
MIDKRSIKKAIGIAGIAMLGINLALFSFRIYSLTVFWIILGIAGGISYLLLRLIK